jgi:hypothetical protein
MVITVPRQPARAGIDPHRKFIERDRDDNVKEIGTSVRLRVTTPSQRR